MMSAIRVRTASSLADRPAPFGAIDGGNVCRPTRSLTSHRYRTSQATQPAGNPSAGERSATQSLPRERGRPVMA